MTRIFLQGLEFFVTVFGHVEYPKKGQILITGPKILLLQMTYENGLITIQKKFAEFSNLYLDELSKNPKSNEFVNLVRESLKKEDVLLLIGARDNQHNHGLVLEDFLNKRLAQND